MGMINHQGFSLKDANKQVKMLKNMTNGFSWKVEDNKMKTILLKSYIINLNLLNMLITKCHF